MTTKTSKRFAIVTGGIGSDNVETIRAYLPANYQATEGTEDDPRIRIAGTDDHGWTLDGYVLPRLNSALIVAEEVGVQWVSKHDDEGYIRTEVIARELADDLSRRIVREGIPWGDWRIDEDMNFGWTVSIIRDEDDARIVLRGNAPMRGRLKVTGDFPKNFHPSQYQYGDPPPPPHYKPITVGMDRDLAAIVSTVAKRFVPGYLAEYRRQCEKKEEEEASNARAESVAEELGKLLGGRTGRWRGQYPVEGEKGNQFESGCQDFSGEVVDFGTSERPTKVHIKIDGVSVEAARALAKTFQEFSEEEG